MSLHDQMPPIGTTYHREFRDLDTRRLPSAPPRLGQSSIEPPKEKPMSKTHAIINLVQAKARDPDSAMKPAEISHDLGGEAAGLDTGTVAALLRCAINGNSYPNLRREQRGQAFYWYWGEPRPIAAAPAQQREPAAEPQSADDQPVDAADALLAAIDEMPAGATIPHAAIHAKRLRKLARLPWIIPEVALWLNELADLVEGGAQ
jgi:hypothetical protein